MREYSYRELVDAREDFIAAFPNEPKPRLGFDLHETAVPVLRRCIEINSVEPLELWRRQQLDELGPGNVW